MLPRATKSHRPDPSRLRLGGKAAGHWWAINLGAMGSITVNSGTSTAQLGASRRTTAIPPIRGKPAIRHSGCR
jgi:hypothetical protein